MNDQNNSDLDNPLEMSRPNTYDEAYYNDDEAAVLYDTYLMLRDYGFDADDLFPLMFAIENLTIYEATSPEVLRLRLQYEEVVEEM